MSILFSCTKCRSQIRVPDGTEGKKTKCPQCQEIQVIPAGSTSSPGLGSSAGGLGAPAPPNPPSSSQPPAKQESMWDDLDLKPAQDTRKPNPFSDGPDPFGAPMQNPYSSPHGGSSAYARPASRDSARTQLMGPAIGVIVGQVLGFFVMIPFLMGVVSGVQEAAAEGESPEAKIIAFIILFVMFGLPPLLSFFTIFAMIRAMAVRNYGIVLTGFILSITPLSGCVSCVVALIFGVWGIVVMFDDSVKAAFRQP